AATLDPNGPDRMYGLVKASLTGSIVGNILLVLGLSILAGGLRYRRQTFNRTAAGMGTTMLALAVIGLIVPSIFYNILLSGHPTPPQQKTVTWPSEEPAPIRPFVSVLTRVSPLKPPHPLSAAPEKGPQAPAPPPQRKGPRQKSMIVLAVATAGVALMSEFLV